MPTTRRPRGRPHLPSGLKRGAVKAIADRFGYTRTHVSLVANGAAGREGSPELLAAIAEAREAYARELREAKAAGKAAAKQGAKKSAGRPRKGTTSPAAA